MKLYYDTIPPPCQAVLLAASTLGTEASMELVRVDVMKCEQFAEGFRQVNPLHQVPVLELDDGERLTESRAIMILLAELAGETGRALYPPGPIRRALCHRWLLFDLTCLYPRLKDYHLPVVERRAGQLVAAALPPLHEALAVLDAQLERQNYAAGDDLSIADLGLATTVAQARAVGVDLTKYAAIGAWYDRLRGRLPGLPRAEKASEEYAEILRNCMKEWDRRGEAENADGDGAEQS